MREAFISDIHAEEKRLLTAIRLLKEHGYDRMYCLGDLVEESPPKEAETRACADIVREHCAAWIMGNHDSYALRKAIFKDAKTAEYLSAARLAIREDAKIYAHISPTLTCTPDISNFLGRSSYVDTPDKAMWEFENDSFSLAFIGHTHVPEAFGSDGSRHSFTKTKTLELDPNLRWILSVGAVGFSRDYNKALSCAIYDSKAATFTVIRPL